MQRGALNQLGRALLQQQPPGDGWVVQGWLVTVVFQRGDDPDTRLARLGTCQADDTAPEEIAAAALPLVRQRGPRP
jgi:hypothetical protein